MKLGIIPMAGKGSRWGGYYKELLPVGDGEFLCDRAIDAVVGGGADKICIVTNSDKVQVHMKHFTKEKYKDLNIFFVSQENQQLDIWGAIKATFPYTEEYNMFAMPDTYLHPDVFKYVPKSDITFGTFKTTMPERFGVFLNDVGMIVNKNPLLQGKEFDAWGTVQWSSNAVKLWKYYNLMLRDYTGAFNAVIMEMGFNKIAMPYYYDFASWKDYQEWIQHL